MHGSAPLVRSVASLVSQTTSKIPHLRCHIAVRQGQQRQRLRQNVYGSPLLQHRRHSTFVAHEYMDPTANDSEARHNASAVYTEPTALGPESSRVSAPTVSSPKSANMFDITAEGLPDRILSGLMSDSIGTPFIRQADDHIFKKALLSLDPAYFIEPFKETSRHLRGPRSSHALPSRSIDHRMTAFALYLDRIVALRRESGWKLDLETCNHLLRCAGSMGDANLARSIMKKVMLADGVEPDLESYNHYCQAINWSHAYSSAENYNLRVIPRHLDIRSSSSPPENLSGHTTSSAKHGGGVRKEVLEMFKECTSKGHTGSELTFVNLMVAMGREADMEGVKSILKSVWNIDVNLLGAYDEEEIESPTFYEKEHALRPSDNLLYSIAHIFGSNNDVRTAWLLVDFISRNYDLHITERVWLHLCEWAFVLSLRRSDAARKQGRTKGQISQETFTQLLEVMMDEPHNIKPGAVIHFLLSRSWRDKMNLDNTIDHILKLGEEVDQQHIQVQTLADEVLQYATAANKSNDPEAFMSQAFYALRRRFTNAFYEFQRGMQFMNVAVSKNLFAETNWPGAGKMTEWERRKVPDLVQMLTAYLPDRVVYHTKTGTVNLVTRQKRMAHVHDIRKMDYRVLPRILTAMDTEDQARLDRRMRLLPRTILRRRRYCFKCESDGHDGKKCPNKPFTSTAFDYQGKKADDATDSATRDILVLDPSGSKELPNALWMDRNEKLHSNPSLPFRWYYVDEE